MNRTQPGVLPPVPYSGVQPKQFDRTKPRGQCTLIYQMAVNL